MVSCSLEIARVKSAAEIKISMVGTSYSTNRQPKIREDLFGPAKSTLITGLYPATVKEGEVLYRRIFTVT